MKTLWIWMTALTLLFLALRALSVHGDHRYFNARRQFLSTQQDHEWLPMPRGHLDRG
jgi:hypothetical protein